MANKAGKVLGKTSARVINKSYSLVKDTGKSFTSEIKDSELGSDLKKGWTKFIKFFEDEDSKN
jgi:hypothetical protein